MGHGGGSFIIGAWAGTRSRGEQEMEGMADKEEEAVGTILAQSLSAWVLRTRSGLSRGVCRASEDEHRPRRDKPAPAPNHPPGWSHMVIWNNRTKVGSKGPAIAQSLLVRGRTGHDQQHTYHVTTGISCALIGPLLVGST